MERIVVHRIFSMKMVKMCVRGGVVHRCSEKTTCNYR